MATATKTDRRREMERHMLAFLRTRPFASVDEIRREVGGDRALIDRVRRGLEDRGKIRYVRGFVARKGGK